MNQSNKFPRLRALLLSAALLLAPLSSFAGVFVSVNIAPPPLPVYEQPVAPAEGYIWTPGYWGWDDDAADYYWVPGTWVLAPEPGYLWTPGWWGWSDAVFIWHAGYWGPHVGFYGGVNYGYGYSGDGYHGGEWRDGRFFYNRSVNNVDITRIHNTYNTTVVNNITVNRVSYNGGDGGTRARPTAQEQNWEHEHHVEATAHQQEHQQAAHADRAQFASANQGRPAVFATPRPGALHEKGVIQQGQAAPFKPGNGAYLKGGAANGGPGQEHGNAPAYVQHDRVPEGEHTPIQAQRREPLQRGAEGAPAYVQHDRVPEGGHTPIQPRRDIPIQHEPQRDVQREMPQRDVQREMPQRDVQREMPQQRPEPRANGPAIHQPQPRMEAPQRFEPQQQPRVQAPPPRLDAPRMAPPHLQEPPHPQAPRPEPRPQERREPQR